MPGELDDALVVDFPLRGDGWMAVTTPAHRIPSHGVDMLGQRFAYDIVKVDRRKGVNVHPASPLRGIVIGGRTREAFAWGATVHSPVDGEVVTASDGYPERDWIHPLADIARIIKNGVTFTPDKIPDLLGNHVILRFGDVYAGFAHLAPGTVNVTDGQRIVVGDVLGRVGHTGNSTSPHLHFQLMDSPDLMVANGIPCAFRQYEVERDGEWVRVTDGIPGRRERLRSVGHPHSVTGA